MKFVIFHGSFGHAQEHWFPVVTKSLSDFDQAVIVPNFPCEDWDEMTKNGPDVKPQNQSLSSWLNVFDTIYKTFSEGDKLCFVGQSLGPLFILHVVEKYNIQLDSAIFVCPFLDSLDKFWQADIVNSTFYKTDFDFTKLKQLIPTSYVLYSDNDPYVINEKSLDFANKLESSCIELKGAGHINKPENASLIYELCKTRIG